MNFVIHICKNKKCNNAWIDTDVTNAKSIPPSWRYCPTCCKKYGFTNPAKPPISKKKQEQLKKARSKIEKMLLNEGFYKNNIIT